MPQGIENSLQRKLNGALRILKEANQQNDTAAYGKLGAFVNEAKAQRSKKIDETDADALISEAQQIMAEMCG